MDSDYIHVRESFVTGKLKIKEHKKLTDGLDGGANNVHYESDGSEVLTSIPLGKNSIKSKNSKNEVNSAPAKKGKKRTKASPSMRESRNEALLPNVSEQYEANTIPS
jgi:hypothetical protein|tara:strand:+ start:269 stop:589 length:321 start_codon:yes stop_codon:yes gene_type:complete